MASRTLSAGGNIWKLSVIRASSDALFFIPIAVPFFVSNGLAVADVFYLQTVFTAALVVFEIPSGYISDRWGRKQTIVTGSAIGVIGIIAYALSTDFWDFFLAEILLALSVSLHSGTLEAMTYDTLLETHDAQRYRKVIGSQFFWTFLVQGCAGIVGGMLAGTALRLPAYVTIGSFVCALSISLLLREPTRHKPQIENHVSEILRIARQTLIYNVPLRSVIAVFSVLASLTLGLVWFSQPYQEAAGLPLTLFGLAHALMVVGGACASSLTHRAEKFVDDRWFLAGIAAVVAGCYIGLGMTVSLWGIALLVIGRSAFGAFNALCGDLVNRMTASDVRATVISIQNFVFRMVFTALSPLLGYVTGVLSLMQTMLWTGIGGGAVLLMIFLLMHNVWKRIPA